MADRPRLRCAIYTRKSSEEGLEQDFNSLEAQREACEAYIASQRHEGWHLLDDVYDDGGFSGGSMDRPALRKMLVDIRAHKIEVVVVYKVDRLTRSLSDFAKIVETFDGHKVSFVSVTQAFNTTTSMGRLTLNVLLSFAQYEREVTGERIRDKIEASKKKGLWMGGFVPPGYRTNGRTLVIEPKEGETIRLIFQRYLELGTVRKLEADLAARVVIAPARETSGGRTIGGRPFSRGQLYKLLGNPIYCGEIRHKGLRYAGQHDAIVHPDVFDRVQRLLATNTHGQRTGRGSRHSSLLAGLLFDADREKLVASHATKVGKRYRYYVSRTLQEGRRPGPSARAAGAGKPSGWRLPAEQIETLVLAALKDCLSDQCWLLDAAKSLCGADQLTSGERDRMVDGARKLGLEFGDRNRSGLKDTLNGLIDRISLRNDRITIGFDQQGLGTALGLEPQCLSKASTPIVLDLPMTLRRRGNETRLVIEESSDKAAEPDQTMIRAIARARRWMADLVTGVHPNIVELAQAYGTDARYVARHLPLACLAPRIVEAIVAGRQPPELTTWDMLNRIDLPFDWDAQARHLGFGQ